MLPLLFNPRNHFLPVFDLRERYAIRYYCVLVFPELPAPFLLESLSKAKLIFYVHVLAFALAPLVVAEKKYGSRLWVCDALERVLERVVDEELGVELFANLDTGTFSSAGA